ncbi:MAG: hypothetical protein WBD45_08760, partial [Terriglobales bacterium]
MGITRRAFLAQGGMATMTLAMRRAAAQTAPAIHESPATQKSRERTLLNARSLAPFVDPLPVPEIIQASGHRPSPDNPAVQLPYY